MNEIARGKRKSGKEPEIGEYLGVSKDTVYAWVTQKGMPEHKVGRFWKFKRQDVDEWVRSAGAADADPGKQEG